MLRHHSVSARGCDISRQSTPCEQPHSQGWQAPSWQWPLSVTSIAAHHTVHRVGQPPFESRLRSVLAPVRSQEVEARGAPTRTTDGLRVGVIGFGYWGPNLVRNFFEAPGSTVTAVSDLDEKNLEIVNGRYPTVHLTTDYRALLKSPDIDAVAIATPASTHYSIAREALEAGKHVWVEKPLTLAHAEALQLTEIAARKQHVLMVDHTFIYTPAVQLMHQRVETRALGDLLYYDSVRVNLGLYQHDVNVIWDLGIHDVAVMDYLLPHRPVAISASGASHIGNGSGSHSIAYVTVYYQENFIAHFHVNWLAPVKTRLITLCGTNEMIVYDDTIPDEKLRIYDRGVMVRSDSQQRQRLQVDYRTGDMHAPKLDRTEALQVAARHFAECVESGERPMTDGEAGSRAVAVLEAAQRSLSSGGRLEKIHWERP